MHKHGAMMLCQISHRGLAALPVFSRMPVWAPSPSRSPHTGEMAHAVTLAEIREIVAGFVQTAKNFMEGGYDGVEIHCTHGHLLNSFLNPRLNWRSDAYGGSVENRLRLVVEVLEGLRTLPLGILAVEAINRLRDERGAEAAAQMAQIDFAQIGAAAGVPFFVYNSPVEMGGVKVTTDTCGCAAKANAAARSPGTTLNKPGGKPAAIANSANNNAVSVPAGCGFTTTALPAANAGATLCATRFNGKLKGLIPTIGPSGTRRTCASRPSVPGIQSRGTTSP